MIFLVLRQPFSNGTAHDKGDRPLVPLAVFKNFLELFRCEADRNLLAVSLFWRFLAWHGDTS